MYDVKRPGARLIGGALVGVMVLGSALGAEAATKKKKVKKPVKVTRTVTLNYTGGCVAEAWVDSGDGGGAELPVCPPGAGHAALQAHPGEKFVSVTVKDASGRNVPGEFWEQGSGAADDTEIQFCGALKNYQFPADGALTFDLDAVGALASCPGTSTQGTVTFVFSNLP